MGSGRRQNCVEARREESGADEVFIDGDSAPFVPEVRIIIRYF